MHVEFQHLHMYMPYSHFLSRKSLDALSLGKIDFQTMLYYEKILLPYFEEK